MTRTFCDAGVLIAAARSVGPDRLRALQLLEEPDRVFLTSPFIHLEVVPKTIFYIIRNAWSSRSTLGTSTTQSGSTNWTRLMLCCGSNSSSIAICGHGWTPLLRPHRPWPGCMTMGSSLKSRGRWQLDSRKQAEVSKVDFREDVIG